MDQPRRILIVDDDSLGRRVLSVIVTSLGHKVTEAASGEAALDLLASTEFDLVLLDLIMPGMGGFATLERMQADPASKEIPVIVISGVEGMDAVIRSIEMGATDYLQKPVDRTLLRARLNSSLSSKRMRDREREHLRDMQRIHSRLEAVIGNSPLGIVLVDLEGRITEANAAFIEMLGGFSTNIVGRRLSDFCAEVDKACAKEIDRFLREERKGAFSNEARMQRIDEGSF